MSRFLLSLFFLLALSACAEKPALQLSPGYAAGQYQVTYLDIQPDAQLAKKMTESEAAAFRVASLKKDLMPRLIKAFSKGRRSQTHVGLTVRLKEAQPPGTIAEGYVSADLILWNPKTKQQVGSIPFYYSPTPAVGGGGIAGIIGNAIGNVVTAGLREENFYTDLTEQITATVFPEQK